MKVIATTQGFFGSRRRPGDVFDVPSGTKGKWFVAAPAVEPLAPAEEAAKPKGRKARAADVPGASDLI